MPTDAPISKQLIRDSSGKTVGIVLPIEDYEDLIDDMEDVPDVKARRGEGSIAHDEFVRQLKEEGYLLD